MTVFVTEKSINGVLCALFKSFTEKIIPDDVTDGKIFQPKLGDSLIKIFTDEKNAERVQTALVKYGGYYVTDSLKTCLSSGNDKAMLIAFNFAYKTLAARKNVYANLSDPIVSDFVFTERKVRSEIHLMKGFLRFRESAGGVIYARYSPDNDITESLAPHFLKRFSGLPFIIHDVKRGRLAISDGFRLKFDDTDLKADFKPSERETEFENLWKRYYKEVNIAERKNERQQNARMPKRYRRFTPEAYEE